jgi:nucleoside 2-deoxyribosyltransferase
MTCPVCGRQGAEDLGQVEGRDQRLIRCPRCGRFAADAILNLTEPQLARRHLLTAALRALSDSDRPATLTNATADRLVHSAPRPLTLFEAVDRLLLLLAGRAPDYWSTVPFDKEVDYPLIVARSPEEMNHLLVTAGQLGWFDIHKSIITLDGWRRIEQLRATQPKARQALVAMSFAPALTPAWEDAFRKGIEDSQYYTAVRVDSFEYNEKIDDRIIAEIRRSGLLVADFTGQRPGVYFEAGFAMGLGIPVVWTCREDEANLLHFDTRQYNHILWKDPADLRTRLDSRIRATVLPRIANSGA